MTPTTSVDALYSVRRGAVDIVDVPEFAYLMVEGRGDPNGAEFNAAVRTLYAIGYGAHFLLRKREGRAPKVTPLEALWWVDDGNPWDLPEVDRGRWRWQAMIMQPAGIDDGLIAEAAAKASTRQQVLLSRWRFEHWREGRCAQVLHVGPYAEERPTLARLHEAIAAAGYRPCGRHHEIYLGDPRRSRPERLRTILRQPVEPG